MSSRRSRRILGRLAVLLAYCASAAVFAQATATLSPPPTPQQQLLAALEQIVAKHPRHVGAIYVAARTAAGIGDDVAAIRWLDRLADVGMDDELDPDDFGAFASTSAYRERAARFAANAPPIGKALRASETQCGDLLPEGIAWDARRAELLVSSGRRRTVIAVDAQGRCRDVVPPGDRGLLAVLGMLGEPSTDSLWVASTAAPFMLDRKPQDAGRSLLARIDLATGRVAEVHPLAAPGMLNDLARAGDGSIYVTESQGGTIWRLPKGGTALTRILPAGTFESPNGIAWLDSGALVVADFDGLALVLAPSTDAPRVQRLATPGDVYLGGIDGLARSGAGLVAIQNLVGRTRIFSLTLDEAKGRVVRADILMRGHPDFRNPTTAVVVGDRVVFVADTKLQSLAPDGTLTALPPERTGHRVLEIPVTASR